MSKLVLNALVTRALVDEGFRRDLLNGHRAHRLAEFPLGEEEQAVLLSIHAHSMKAFAAQVDRLLRGEATPSLGYTYRYNAPPTVPVGAGTD